MGDVTSEKQSKKPNPCIKYSVEEIAAALLKTQGKVALASRLLGCAFSPLYRRIKRNAALTKILKDQIELRLDVAEQKLDQLVMKGELGAICFLLKCRAKDRGYIERQEFTGKDGGPMGVSLISVLTAAHAQRGKKTNESTSPS
jgi:hypothetical protein